MFSLLTDNSVKRNAKKWWQVSVKSCSRPVWSKNTRFGRPAAETIKPHSDCRQIRFIISNSEQSPQVFACRPLQPICTGCCGNDKGVSIYVRWWYGFSNTEAWETDLSSRPSKRSCHYVVESLFQRDRSLTAALWVVLSAALPAAACILLSCSDVPPWLWTGCCHWMSSLQLSRKMLWNPTWASKIAFRTKCGLDRSCKYLISVFFLPSRRPKPIWMCRNKQIWSWSLYGTWTTYLTTINDHFSSISAFLLDSYSWRELEKAGKREDSVFGLKKTAFCIIFWCVFFFTEKSSWLIEWINSCGPNLTSTE